MAPIGKREQQGGNKKAKSQAVTMKETKKVSLFQPLAALSALEEG